MESGFTDSLLKMQTTIFIICVQNTGQHFNFLLCIHILINRQLVHTVLKSVMLNFYCPEEESRIQ